MILEAEHPAAIFCARGVLVNGKMNKRIVAIELGANRIRELRFVPSFSDAERRGGGSYGSGMAFKWHSVSSAEVAWQEGHGPGSDCERCGGLFEL